MTTDSGSSATDKITNDASSFEFTVPSGQRSNIVAASTATVYIYDVVAGACEAPTGSNGGWASHATETGTAGYDSGTGVWTVDGSGTNPTDGEHCYTAVYDTDGSTATVDPSHYADAIKVQTDDTAPTAPTAVASQNGTSGSASTITIRVTAAAGTARLYTSSTCATQSGTNEAAISSGTADVETPTLNTGANTFYGGVVDTAGNVACFATGVTYTKSAPAVTATLAAVNPGSLTESNLDNATVDVTISSGTINQTLTAANFTTTGIAGLTVDGAVRQTNTATVRLTLNFDGTDFDSDDSFTVTVPATEHSGSGSITSASLSVTAVNDPPKATGLALETDSGSSATDKITNDATGFTFTVPSAQRASVASGSTATVYIYDVVAGACEAPTGSNGGWASHATETDNTGYSSGTWTVDGGTNPADGEHCYTAVYDLDGSGNTYVPSHYADAIKVQTDDTDPTAPTGIAVASATGTGATVVVTVTAAANSKVWLYEDSSCATRRGTVEGTVAAGATDVDITSPSLTVGAHTIYGGVVDTAGNVGCYATGATYTRSATATLAAVNPSSLGEGDLNGATVDVTLSSGTFNGALTPGNFTTTGITGLTVSAAARNTNTAAARLTLAYTGADFDSDTSFTVTVPASQYSGSVAVTSASLAVTAVNDPPKGTALALETDSGVSATDKITNDATGFTFTVPVAQQASVATGSTATVYRYNTNAGGNCDAPSSSNSGWQSHATESDNTGYSSGTWTVDGGTNPTDGTHCYTAVYDLDGATATYAPSHYSDAIKVQTDDTAPTAPTDIAVSSSEGFTTTVNVTVTAAAGSKVRLYSDSSCNTRRGTVEGTVAGGGTTVVITSPTLAVGGNDLYGGVVDDAGNVGCYGTAATYTRKVGIAVTAASPSPLTEDALDGATVDVTLTGTQYVADATLQTAMFTINPVSISGVTVSGYERRSNTVVRLTLAFDGTDFDSDSFLRIVVDNTSYADSSAPTTTTYPTVLAVNDPPKVTGLALETDSGSSSSDGITNDATGFSFTVPSAQRSSIAAASTATVYRYDTNAGDTCDAPTGSNTNWATHRSVTGTSSYNSGTGVWTVSGATNPADDEHCYTAVYDLDGATATYDESHYADAIKVETDDTDPTAPTAAASQNGASGSRSTITVRVTADNGLTARLYTDSSCATRHGSNEATVSSGTADVVTGTLSGGPNTVYAGVVDTAGNLGCRSTGVSYTRTTAGTLAANNPAALKEDNLNTATVDVTLSVGSFNATLTPASFTTSMTGLTVSAATRQTNQATARLTLAYTGADFDADTSFSVTVASSEHSGSDSVTTGTLAVTAINDPAKGTGLALTTDSGISSSDLLTNDATSFSFTVPAAHRSSIASGSTATVYRYNTVASACEAPTGSNGGWQTHASESDNTGYSSGVWTVDGSGANPSDGTHCYTAVYDLDGSTATISPSHYADAIKVQTDDTNPTAPTLISIPSTTGSAPTVDVTVTAASGRPRVALRGQFLCDQTGYG